MTEVDGDPETGKILPEQKVLSQTSNSIRSTEVTFRDDGTFPGPSDGKVEEPNERREAPTPTERKVGRDG